MNFFFVLENPNPATCSKVKPQISEFLGATYSVQISPQHSEVKSKIIFKELKTVANNNFNDELLIVLYSRYTVAMLVDTLYYRHHRLRVIAIATKKKHIV